MWAVGDEELAEVTGEGFSTFTLQSDVTRAVFNITAKTYTEIDSLKMGYYDRGMDNLWDENWQGVKLGTADTDLVLSKLFIEAGFTNITDPSTRTLNYVKLGAEQVTGPISANFVSFTGRIDNGGSTILDATRQNLGQRTITSMGSEFSVTLSRDSGWKFYWGNATISPPTP